MGYWTKVLIKMILLLISAIAIYLSFKLAIFYTPFLIGFIISLLIEPIIKFVVKKTNITRKTVAIIVLLIIFSILIGLVTLGIISIITESSKLLQSLNVYIEKIYNQIQGYINSLEFDKIQIPEQVISVVQNGAESFLGLISRGITNFLTAVLQSITSFPIMVIYVIITILSTYFICTDRLYIIDQLEHHFPKLWIKKIAVHLREIISALGSYLKAEMILILITFVIVTVGLYIFKFSRIKYRISISCSIGSGIC